MKNWQSTLALAALMVGLFGWLVKDIRGLRSEVRADIGTLRADIGTLRGDVTALRERMARMEALILRGATAEEAHAPGDQPDTPFQNTSGNLRPRQVDTYSL